MPKESDDLTREGDKPQKTPKAKLRIPTPKRSAFDELLRKAAPSKRKPSDESAPDPSQSER